MWRWHLWYGALSVTSAIRSQKWIAVIKMYQSFLMAWYTGESAGVDNE